MATDLFKVPQAKRPLEDRSGIEAWSPTKKKRIKDTFLKFCDIVLQYTQYSPVRNQELRHGNNRSPLDSVGSTADSVTSDSAYLWEDEQFASSASRDLMASPPGNEVVADDTSFDVVTCFCGKPYMGRPMIECSVCVNWLHLSCVHLRKSNIPETYICEACKRSPPQQKSSSAKRKAQHRKLQMAHAKEKAKAGSYSPPSGGGFTPSGGGFTSPSAHSSMVASYTPAASGVMRPSFTPVSDVTMSPNTPSPQSNGSTLSTYEHPNVTSQPNVSPDVPVRASTAHARNATPPYNGADSSNYFASPVLQNSSAVNRHIIDTRKVSVHTWKPPSHFERTIDEPPK